MSNELHIVGTRAFLRLLDPKFERGCSKRAIVGTATYLGVNRGRIITIREITDWLYAHDVDGGPLWAVNSVRQAVVRLRRRGMEIISIPGRGYIVPLPK